MPFSSCGGSGLDFGVLLGQNDSKGGLFKTLLLLLNPINKTSIVIPGNRITKGIHEGINGASKASHANN